MSVDKKVPEIRFEVFSGEWEEKKLGELAEILRGASPRPIEDPKWFDSNSSVGWLRIRDVTEQDGRISYLEQRISKLGQEKTRVLHTKSLLLSIAASVGKPVINYVETGVHDGFLIFKKPFFELEFMYQWLKSFEEKWKQYGQPGSQVNLNSDIVKSQSVTLPTKKEQTQIGDYFQKLDTLINQHQKKHDKLCNIKKAMLEKMFPKQGETIPEIRFRKFSGEWKSDNLESVVSFYKGKNLPKSSIQDDGVFPCIHYGELFTKYSEVIEVVTSRTNQNDNFFSISNDVLMPTSDVTPKGLVKSCCIKQSGVVLGGDILIIRPEDKNVIDGAFLSRFIRSREQQVLQNVTGTTVFHLYASSIEKLDIVFPFIEEQNAISNYFQKLDNLINQHQQQITKLNNIKQACLSKMFV